MPIRWDLGEEVAFQTQCDKRGEVRVLREGQEGLCVMRRSNTKNFSEKGTSELREE